MGNIRYNYSLNSDAAMTTISMMLAMSMLRYINHIRQKGKSRRDVKEQMRSLEKMNEELRNELASEKRQLDEMKKELEREKDNHEENVLVKKYKAFESQDPPVDMTKVMIEALEAVENLKESAVEKNSGQSSENPGEYNSGRRKHL